ncbi:MAG: Unknown protein [uncultured Sulfurovum sp.]|uniref:Uncharacterized protein n=1 Tax=uncultured Sulfurovum sp. TaxID=269237 RepID=A0A6S6TWK3_9BACT|nr:MAG: Unknown protein [uncultured Sulfurovum sp.]
MLIVMQVLGEEIVDTKLLSTEEQTFIDDLRTFILDRAKKFKEIAKVTL